MAHPYGFEVRLRAVQAVGTGARRVDLSWRPEFPDGELSYLQLLEVLDPGGVPLLRVPFFLPHEGTDIRMLHTVCGRDPDGTESVRAVEW
jgi:hypothetical protein